jgi:hypothetical protein
MHACAQAQPPPPVPAETPAAAAVAAAAEKRARERQRMEANVEKEIDRLIDSQDNVYVLSRPKCELLSLRFSDSGRACEGAEHVNTPQCAGWLHGACLACSVPLRWA